MLARLHFVAFILFLLSAVHEKRVMIIETAMFRIVLVCVMQNFPAGSGGVVVKSKVRGKTGEESQAAPVLPAVQDWGEHLTLPRMLL